VIENDSSDVSEEMIHALELKISVLESQFEQGREDAERAAIVAETGLTQFSNYEDRIRTLTDENRKLQARNAELEDQIQSTEKETLTYLQSSLSANQRGLFLRNQLVAYQNEIKAISKS
jgi:predicted nuclease with TOPRIM domain